MTQREFQYRCEQLEDLVQRVANLIPNGYYFYVYSRIPERTSPTEVAVRLIHQYQMDVSDWQRWKDKRDGVARLKLLIWRRHLLLLATHGEHVFHRRESGAIRDLRQGMSRYKSLQIRGYSVAAVSKGGKRSGRFTARVGLTRTARRRLQSVSR